MVPLRPARFVALLPFALAAVAAAEPLTARPVPPPLRPAADPDFTITSAETTWILVGQNCATADTVGSPHNQTPAHVWCFEGASGDPSWPANPPAHWQHWSRYAPPGGAPSRWHVTPAHGGATTGAFNAWCGCDSTGAPSACADVAWWVFQDGYGDHWAYSLTLDMAGQDASAGGSVQFDLRYDAECNYDYVYLEYLRSSNGQWTVLTDASGNPARFNGVSGNVGAACGGDYFGHSGTFLGSPYYGNSTWLTDVTFPLPAQSGGMMLRWRATSDGAWSDADGSGDTDGLGAVDNVTVTFTAGGVTVTDDFETGDFSGVVASSGTAMWIPGGLEGNTYDGWHLEFDPKYLNKGNTCTFSNDWMWSAKPPASPIPSNGFDYYLVTPAIDVSGWTGGVIEFADYWCTPDARNDLVTRAWRVHDTTSGWTPLTHYDDYFWVDQNCSVWWMNEQRDLSPFLGPGVDSLQFAWRMVDLSHPGDLSWGVHTQVTYLIDNVSIGSFDATATLLSMTPYQQLGDTFSRVDPAHSQYLDNDEEGQWSGNGGARPFAPEDSLAVRVEDPDGVAAVDLWWRVGSGVPTVWGAWNSKAMVHSSPFGGPGEGVYRSTIGNTTSEDYSSDEAGSLGNPAKDPIWDAGQVVQYYVRIEDVPGEVTTLPKEAAGAQPEYFDFSILPWGRTTPGGDRLLLVDDDVRSRLDFEFSSGFSATGGAGFGGFTDPAFAPAADLMNRSLVLLFGADRWDVYTVDGAGSSQQREPRILADPREGLGGVADSTGIPLYDALLWIHGDRQRGTYLDHTRIDLKAYLDHGGHLLSSGDNVAYELGAGGLNADSTIGFLPDYLGVTFPTVLDDATADRILSVTLLTVVPDAMTLYGECPTRLTFDKLTVAPAVPGVHEPSMFAMYSAGDGQTNGRAAVVRNDRVAGGGRAVHCGFALTALISDHGRACLISRVLEDVFGLQTPMGAPCNLIQIATPEPVPSHAGFDLALPAPSPASGETRVTFSIPVRADVTIAVHDFLGRRVRTLVHERLPADRHVRTWDGRDDEGRLVPTGIYFVKMTAGDFSSSRKAVRLR